MNSEEYGYDQAELADIVKPVLRNGVGMGLAVKPGVEAFYWQELRT